MFCGAQYVPVKSPERSPDNRFIYLSDILPTSWQAVEYANVPDGGSATVFGLGPIGQMTPRRARHRGFRVIAVDLVPECPEMTLKHGIEVLDLQDHDDILETTCEMPDKRSTNSLIHAVGMEARGSPGAKLGQQIAGLLPDSISQYLMKEARADRLNAFYLVTDTVRRGGTISLSGGYGGMAHPLPLLHVFDKQIQLSMDLANVWRWVEGIMPLVTDDAYPFSTENSARHHLPLDQAPHGYEIFQKKQDDANKILLQP